MQPCPQCGTPAQPGLLCCSLAVRNAALRKRGAATTAQVGTVLRRYMPKGQAARTAPAGPMPAAGSCVSNMRGASPALPATRGQVPGTTLSRNLRPNRTVQYVAVHRPNTTARPTTPRNRRKWPGTPNVI